MQTKKAFLMVVFVLLGSVLPGPVHALTFDYLTAAEALAEVGWYDYFGLIVDADYDYNEATNARSYATAFYDEILFMGEVGISALAGASIEPNDVILSTKVAGSYEFDVGWVLMEYFYQDANSTVEGQLRISEFPIGAPCRLRVNISFPDNTWTGLRAWQLYLESSSDYFLAGRDELGDYGLLSGTIDAYAGEPIYVLLDIAGGGYADHDIGDALGYGTLTINAALTAAPHLADLSSDGWINFEDFALFSSHWHEQGCEDPNTGWCQQADFDHSGNVDANDVDLFTGYWLSFLDPNQID
ncbi:MAG: hypothetical protein ACYSYV_09960 [Planctomycetota bacterium]|jgi:hypothetical protein